MSSCVELGLEQQEFFMQHDLFTGDLQDVFFTDGAAKEEVLCLDDDAEIDEILNLAMDPHNIQNLS